MELKSEENEKITTRDIGENMMTLLMIHK